MGQPQGPSSVFLGQGYSHLGFAAPSWTLDDTVLAVVCHLYSFFLVIVERYVPLEIDLNRVCETACEIALLRDEIRQNAECSEGEYQVVSPLLI